jgi:hypothetical protein
MLIVGAPNLNLSYMPTDRDGDRAPEGWEELIKINVKRMHVGIKLKSGQWT